MIKLISEKCKIRYVDGMLQCRNETKDCPLHKNPTTLMMDCIKDDV